MPPPEIVPVNFDLTDEARDEIERLTLAIEAESKQPYLPAVKWHEEYEEAERRLVGRGLVIAWFEAARIPLEAVQRVGRLRIVFDITPVKARKFQGRTIDFNGGRFMFTTANSAG